MKNEIKELLLTAKNLEKSSQDDEAGECYKKALQLADNDCRGKLDDIDPLYTLGQVHIEVGQFIIRHAQRINPTPALNHNSEKINNLLLLIAEGEEKKASDIIEENIELLTYKGNVTDLSERSFKNITPLQLAIWMGDWYMWEMLLTHFEKLDNGVTIAYEQADQYKNGSWIEEHGKNAQKFIKQVIDSAKNYSEKLLDYNQSSDKASARKILNLATESLIEAQFLLPVQVVNQYCNTQRSFEDVPSFREPTLSRTRQTNEGDWFKVIKDRITSQDIESAFRSINSKVSFGGTPYAIDQDRKALDALYEMCYKKEKLLYANLTTQYAKTRSNTSAPVVTAGNIYDSNTNTAVVDTKNNHSLTM